MFSLKIEKWHKVVVGIIIILILIAGTFRIGWVSFVDNYELGFVYNRFSGEITPLNRTGYFIFAPFKYSVHSIDLRPYQISITASFGNEGINSRSGIPSRVLNAKLVKFNPKGLETFVEWHGRDAGDSLANLKEIMKCYAFDKEDGRDCPFIMVLSEINPSQAPDQSSAQQ